MPGILGSRRGRNPVFRSSPGRLRPLQTSPRRGRAPPLAERPPPPSRRCPLTYTACSQSVVSANSGHGSFVPRSSLLCLPCFLSPWLRLTLSSCGQGAGPGQDSAVAYKSSSAVAAGHHVKLDPAGPSPPRAARPGTASPLAKERIPAGPRPAVPQIQLDCWPRDRCAW
ncbi:hypothetical protein CDD83_3270 [Cordyceps sp. RAO-2017]|nr:hypothetical protein CDD83_3270 [Cordyceps sp. RAO-2017]